MNQKRSIPGNKTERLALALAALVLVVLAATRYTGYLEQKLEREVIAKQTANSVTDRIVAEKVATDARLNDRLARLEASLVAAQPDPIAKTEEIETLKEELEAVQKEREVIDDVLDDMAYQQRIDKLAGNRPPDPELGMTEEQKMIRRAAAIATVTDFNKDWGFVVLDGGESRGLSVGTKLALRREGDVVALLQISEIEAASSVANLVRGGPGGRGNVVPEKGDAVIAWPPF